MVVACGFMVFVFLMRSEATPIRPDLNTVLQKAQQDPPQQMPLARAGWNGPEMTPPSQNANSIYNQYGPEASARHARASLLAAATPDYRAVAGILLVILLLRRMRQPRRAPVARATALGETPIVSSGASENPSHLKRVA